MGKHHGSEGRKSIKIALQKLPYVTSETHRKGCDFSYFFLLLLLLLLLQLLLFKRQLPDGKTPWQ